MDDKQANNEKQNVDDNQKVYTELVVDLRATGMHRDEIGLHKIELKAQKDRQWTKDSDIIGMVEKDGEAFGRVVIRNKPWSSEDPLSRRLIIKIFTMNDYWRGTIELLQGESVLHSFTANEECVSYLCVLNGAKSVSRIRQIPQRKRRRGTIFAIDMVDDRGIAQGFMIDDKRFALGSDWEIKNPQGRVVAEIDGKIMDIGGQFRIRIRDAGLAGNKAFYTVLSLFATTLRYQEEVTKNVQKALSKVIEGAPLKLEDSEADFYQNPRKILY